MDLYAPGQGVLSIFTQRFWKHQYHDVLPYIYCCKGQFSDCKAYYDRRPSDDGSNYDCSPPGRFICVY